MLAYCGDPNQTPAFAVSVLGLLCLHMSPKENPRVRFLLIQINFVSIR